MWRATAPVATRPARHSVINSVIRQKRQCMKAKWQSAWCMIKRASSSKKNNSSLQRAHTFMHIQGEPSQMAQRHTLWLPLLLLLGTWICIQMTGSCRNKVAAALYDLFFSQCSLSRAEKEPLPPGRSPNATCQFYSIPCMCAADNVFAHMCHFDKWIWKCAGCGMRQETSGLCRGKCSEICYSSSPVQNYYSDDHANIYFHFYCSMNTNIKGVDFLVLWMYMVFTQDKSAHFAHSSIISLVYC